MLNCSWFQSFVSNPVKRDPILDQFSMITRPSTRINGLKTIPFPAAHTRIANIWEYSPPPSKISKFWPRLVILKFWHSLSLDCSWIVLKTVLVSIMSIIHFGTVIKHLRHSFSFSSLLTRCFLLQKDLQWNATCNDVMCFPTKTCSYICIRRRASIVLSLFIIFGQIWASLFL